jgi:hypothetical protein
MRLKKLAVAAAALILATTLALPAVAASDLWFHVTVNQKSGDNANITVNLPFSIVEAAMPLIPEEAMQDGRIVIEDSEFDAAKLRDLWRAVQDSPDATYVTVQNDDQTIRVYKDGNFLRARTAEATADGTQVDARIPMVVIDALLSGNGNELNLRAALEALVQFGEGELVTVNDKEANVRVWIDRQPEAP